MSTPPRTTRILALLAMLTATLYGLLIIGYPVSLIQGEWPLSSLLIAKLTSVQFITVDDQTLRQVTLNYTRGFGSISAHTMLGGLALTACALQFFPALRRRWPRVHRAVGMTAAVSTLASMLGALWFLSITPASDNVSGQAFAAGLWMLALSTLFALGMAMASIRRREVRAHMGWMALLMASLMTAPLLRMEDIILGRLLPLNIVQANAGLAAMLMPQTVLLMAWWMNRVGRLDMPLLPAQASITPGAWRAATWLGVATVIHEGLLAPWGVDALAHWRSGAERLPAIAGLWAVASAALLPRLRTALPAVMRGAPLSADTLALMATAGWGALLIAIQLMPAGRIPQDLHQLEKLFFWATFGASNLLYALAGLLGRGRQDRVQANWRTMGIMNAFVPAAWLPYGLGLACTGWPAGAVTSAALSLSWGFFAWHGFMSAFGLPVPGVKTAPAPQAGESLA